MYCAPQLSKVSSQSVFYNGNVVKYQGCGRPVQSGLSVLRAPQVAPLQAHWIVGAWLATSVRPFITIYF
jgi:hypothetical protein